MTDATGHPNDFDDDSGVRLDFDVDPSVCTVLDGAWWPQTQDSATELAGLVAALQAKKVVVSLIMLNPHGWLGHPRRIEVAHHAVRIAWIPSFDPAILVGTTVRGRRVDLLLVAPEADQTDRGADAAVDGRAPGLRPPTEPASPHAALRASMLATTQALALATLDRGPPDAWIDSVRAALVTLRADLHAYHRLADGRTGTYQQVLASTPRLSHAVADLGRQQAEIGQLLDRTLACIAEPAAPTQSHRVRMQGLAVLRRLYRYQQHDADLLHQADQVDVGGQG